MKILVTGGAGYIGSHTCLALLEKGYEVIVVDNFSNSKIESLNRVKTLTGKSVKAYTVDIRNRAQLEEIFSHHKIDAVIHFAGLKAVGESCKTPLLYYDNNVNGSINLFEIMQEHGTRNIVFSSSATVYGEPECIPINENAQVSPSNPYGRTKLMIENILRDIQSADPDWNITILRYFNPIGAHESGLIGEDPSDIPNNLMPYISQVAIGKLPELQIYGDDYETPDGTGVRDYIHVMDLAEGHVCAIKQFQDSSGFKIYNLGTGNGYSVMELTKIFRKVTGAKISYKIVQRRPGDIAVCYADPSLANKELDWRARHDIEQMCRDSWNWQSKNPRGYEGR